MSGASSMRTLLVLGMHRSGTSAVARVINLLGADLGAPLLEAQADNSIGFWELAPIKEIHDRVLQSQGLAWDGLVPMSPQWFDSALAAEARQEIAAVLRNNFRASSLFLVKEPQLCLLLPLWKPVLAEFGAYPGVVLVVRDPGAVAGSLLTRNGMGRHRAMALWLRYMLEAELQSRGMPRYFLSYSKLVENWRSCVAALGAGLGIQWPLAVDRVAPEVDVFLGPGNRPAAERESDWVLEFPWVARAWLILQRFAHQGEDAQGLLELDQIRHEFDVALAAIGPIVEQAESVRPAHQLAQLLSQAENRIMAMTTSTSWRVTAPLRRVMDKVRRLGSQITGQAKTASSKPRRSRRAGKRASVVMGMDADTGPYFELTAALPMGLDAELRRGHGIEIPTRISATALGAAGNGTPRVSVIVPLFNNLACTLLCLESLRRHAPNFNYEVIVVDDASTERETRHLSACANVRYLRNQTNQGFVHSCNRGAQLARGAFLAFLNNDTLPQPRWLDELVATLEADEKIGLVGAKLLNADGTLQEAGALVWSDATAWNRGRNGDPGDPEFNYLKDVDYCSGATILVRREAFLELGGFNPDFAPAYYEDTDLAFRLRRRNLRVVYQPLARVIHLEGLTSGQSLSVGIKAYQQINRAKFLSRWAPELAAQPAHQGELEQRAQRRAGQVLIIDSGTPTPDQDSGSTDVFNMMLILVRLGYQVTFLPAQELRHDGRYTEALQRIGVRCLYRPFCDSVTRHLRREGARYDFVFLNRLPVAHDYSRLVRRFCPRARVIFNTIDLHFLRASREVALGGSWREKAYVHLCRFRELSQIDGADCTLLMSSAEMRMISALRPKASLSRLPLIITTEDRQEVAFEARHGLLFVGGFKHKPNVDAVRYLLDAICPLLVKLLPNVRLYIVGSHAPPEILNLSMPGVEIVGYTAEIARYFNTCRVNLAPLRYGAGIKGKIGRALGFGLPTVATTLAVEGMDLDTGHEVMVADDPAGFAAGVAELYSDEKRWLAMSKAGRRFFEAHYSLECGMELYKNLLKKDLSRDIGLMGAPGPARVGN